MDQFTQYCANFPHEHLILSLQDLISNSPYCLPDNSNDVSSEKMVMNQLIIL